MHRRIQLMALCLGLVLGAAAGRALGVIELLTPLKSIIDGSDYVVIATVESIDSARPSMTLVISQDLKGTVAERTMPVLLKGDSEGNPREVLDRIKVGTSLIVFVTERDQQHLANVYSEGSWFQIIGHLVDGKPRWGFTHGEPYLRRTFKGSTDEMTQVLTAYLKEKQEPPAVNPKEKPGFGPTLAGVIEPWSPPATKDAKPKPPQSQDKNGQTTTPTPMAAPPAPTAAPDNESLKPWLIAGGVAAALGVLVFAIRKKGA